MRVSASDDLADWQELGRGLPLVALDDNGLRIERLQLDFTASDARYLRLAIVENAQRLRQAVRQIGRALRSEPATVE